jgi:acetyl-CoA acetyltransferase
MTSRSVVFAEPVRTAIGTFRSSLKDIPAPNLGAVAIDAAVGRAKLRPDELETVVMGNVIALSCADALFKGNSRIPFDFAGRKSEIRV